MPLDPDDALDLKFLRDARLSPDGRKVVYAVSSSDRSERTDACVLWLLDLDTGDRHALTDEAVVSASPRWSPDGSMIAYFQAAPLPALMVLAVETGAPARSLTAPGDLVVGAPSWSPDGRRLAVAAGTMLQDDETILRASSHVYRAEGFGVLDLMSLGVWVIDLEDETRRTLVEGSARFQCTDPKWSPRGDRILFMANFDEDSALPGGFPTLRCVDVETGRIDDVLGSWGGCQAADWLPDGERIAFVGAPANWRVMTNMDLWVVGDGGVPERRTPEGPWHVGPRIYQDGPIWDLVMSSGLVVEESGRASITVQRGGAVEIWDVALEGPIDHTPVITGERSCILLDTDPTAGRLFVATDMLHPTDLFLAGESERQLTALNEDVLAGWPVVDVQHLNIAAHDGRDFEGWFLREQHADAPLPTVMHVHGGPYTAVGHAFRFDFHLLASNGMGVVFSNFRGSAGYGQEHMDAIGNDWGNAGFPDHMATIDTAIARGLAHENMLGVWGASHGGFATSWIVGHTNRFIAAVAEASVTDWVLLYYTSDVPDAWKIQHGGNPREVADVMRERSPLTYAHHCTTPILMLHCQGDLRCPPTQAEVFQRAVLDAGCVSELAMIRGGSHIADAMGPAPIRVAQDYAVLDWFERFLTTKRNEPESR